MRISMTQFVRNNPDLRARWLAAVAAGNAVSLVSKIELQGRLERLNILLFNLERDSKIRTSNQVEIVRFQRGVYLLFFIGVVLFALNAALVFFDPLNSEWSALGLIAGVFFLLRGKEQCADAANEAGIRIESARHEFHTLSGTWLEYKDLKLLESESEDEDNNPHLAEIIVGSYERLVEKTCWLEGHEIILGEGVN